MRKGLLTELIGVFEDAKEHRREYGGELAGLDDLRDEVLRLLREGDRLKRRAENTPPSSKRSRRLQDAAQVSDAAKGVASGAKDAP